MNGVYVFEIFFDLIFWIWFFSGFPPSREWRWRVREWQWREWFFLDLIFWIPAFAGMTMGSARMTKGWECGN